MVKVHVKLTDADQFLFETTCAETNAGLITKLVEIWNLRHALSMLADAVDGLSKWGPSKPPDARGLDDIEEQAGKVVEKGAHYTADPQGNRTGNPPGPELAETLQRCAADCRAVVGKQQVARKVNLTRDLLDEKVDNVRGAVMMAYPMGLPVYDLVRSMLEGGDLAAPGMTQQAFDPATATLWWAGKEFPRGKCVGDRLGRNEKTKIVVKIQTTDARGAPAREPAVSEAERKAMMAHYFKKQEEQKRMAEDDDNNYLASTWADSKALKSSLLGTKNIKYR
jgi:hypothetical protein